MATATKPVRKVIKATRTANTSSHGDYPLALQSLIPDIAVAEKYVSRYIRDVEDMDAIAYAHAHHMPVLLAGPTGSAKTTFLAAYCARNKLPFINVPCDGSIEPRALFGGASVDVMSGGLRWIDGPVLLAVKYGGVLYLDEVNMMPGRISSAVNGLCDFRRTLSLSDHPYTHIDPSTGDYVTLDDEAARTTSWPIVEGPAYIKAHDNLLIAAAYNPGYHDTRPLNQAFKNRFSMQLEFDYDPEVEAQLVASENLLRFAADLRKSHEEAVISTPVSTNMLIEFEMLAQDENLQYNFAVEVFLNHFPNDNERKAVRTKLELFGNDIMDDMGWKLAD